MALLLILAIGLILAYSLTFYSHIRSNIRLFLNWMPIISSASAVIMSVLVTLLAWEINRIFSRKRINGVNDKENNQDNGSKYRPFSSFTIGLALWFVAEMSWTYYELGLGIKNPYPSVADAIWLGGYPFIIYFAHRTNNIISKQNAIHDREFIILASVAAASTLAYVLTLTYGIGHIMSHRQGILEWVITIAYPILDVAAFIYCLLIIRKLRNKRESLALSWKLLATSIMLATIADIGFGYSEIIGTTAQEGRTGIWDVIYSTAYTIMAVSMFWQFRALWIKKTELRSDVFG